MFKVYLFSDFHQVTPDDLKNFSAVLTPERREKANSRKVWQAKAATVISELLLRYGLKEWTGSFRFEIARGKWGKPYFISPNNLSFNISHCREACACVIADEEVGLDIEGIRSVRPGVISKVCTEEEAERIRQSESPDEAFIRCWVMKESYAKLLGVGLSRDFRTINTLELKDHFWVARIDQMYVSVARFP